MRRIDAKISSIEGSWTFAGCVISDSTSSTPPDHDSIKSLRIMISSPCLSMIFSENRLPLFRIMPECPESEVRVILQARSLPEFGSRTLETRHSSDVWLRSSFAGLRRA
jgi:hypothetical protein